MEDICTALSVINPRDRYSGMASRHLYSLTMFLFALHFSIDSHVFRLAQGPGLDRINESGCHGDTGPIRIHKLLKRSIVSGCSKHPFKQCQPDSLKNAIEVLEKKCPHLKRMNTHTKEISLERPLPRK